VLVQGKAPDFGRLDCAPAGDTGDLSCYTSDVSDAGFWVTVSGRENTGQISSESFGGAEKLADLTCNF
jgi:hypothetical protein